MDLVINEWFADYCTVGETKENKEILIKFLEKFLQKSDRIFIKRPSPFLIKIDRFAKHQAHRDTSSISLINFFRKSVLLDSKKCVFIDEECQLDDLVVERLNEEGTNYSSDTYLFEAASKTESKIIVTTDDKLREQMHNVAGYKVINLKDFLQQY